MVIKEMFRIPAGKGSKGAEVGGPVSKAQKEKNKIAEKNAKVEKENTKEVKNMTKAVTAGNLISRVISILFSDVFRLFQPLIRILSLLVFVVFLPLIPLITKLTEKLAEFVGKVADIGTKGIAEEAGAKLRGDSGTFGSIMKSVGLLVLAFVAAVIVFLIAGIALIPALIITAILFVVGAIITFWDDIKDIFLGVKDAISAWFDELKQIPAKWAEIFSKIFSTIKDVWGVIIQGFKDFGDWVMGLWEIVWDFFKAGLTPLVNLHLQIWEIFKNGLSGIANLGSRIAGVITSALSNIGSFFSGNRSSRRNDFISRPGQPDIAFSPQDTIIGVKDISKLGGSSGDAITINITGPVFNNDTDIRKLTDKIGMELQRRGNRGFSAI